MNYVDGVTSNIQTQLDSKGAGGGDLLADGTIPLTANWDVGAFTLTGTQFVSDIVTGTAPFVVASTTPVANLEAAKVTTNANLTGHITSTGNAAVLGSFTSLQLLTALSDETGTGLSVFATSPTLTTPLLGTPTSGVLTNCTGLPVTGLANGTDGELITWDASGVAAVVAVGTAAQILTSNGVGVAPTFQAAAGGGIGEFIGDSIAISSDDTALASDDASANKNVGIGYLAGNAATTASYCTFVGSHSGRKVTTGNYNVGIGYSAGQGDATNYMTGQQNVGVGSSTLYNLSTPNYNIAIGDSAMYYTTTGANNIGVGNSACRGAGTGATGNYNTCMGYFTGIALTSGFDNTFIGAASGDTNTTGANNSCFGHDAVSTSATVSNEITLGDANIATLRCQVTTITALSDARDKTNIQTLDAGIDFINSLNPVRFEWDCRDGTKKGITDTGFIAQDLVQVQVDTGIDIPQLVHDLNPERLEAGYGKLLPAMVKALQDLSDENTQLKARLEAIGA